MITKHKVPSCCGKKDALIFEIPKAIRKSQIQPFKDAGFLVPENWLIAGIFYVAKDGITASAAYGATKINVRCSGPKCVELLGLLESTLEVALNSK